MRQSQREDDMVTLSRYGRGGRWLVLALGVAANGGCERPQASRLTGDWDVYIALSATPKFGFEGWRRMAFAHFAAADSNHVGFIRRRTGEAVLMARHVAT